MTQLNIGTGWMIPPKKRPDDDAAYNQLIEKMDLEEVRRMMCPKSRGNVEKCKNCEGFKTCRAGQRAMRLVAEQIEETAKKTAPTFVQKWKEGEPEKVSNNQTSIEREEFRQACASGNAWHWLMENKKLSKDAAGELLSKLVRKYPNISADYGGSRRIMQRPKAVRIVNAQGGLEQASEPQVEETHAEEAKAAETAGNRPKTKREELNEQLAAEARERCGKILATGDPVKALMDEGKTEKQARSKINKWKASYPDLFDGIDPALYRAKPGRKKKAVTEAPEEKQEESDDMVSLADFLEDMGTQEAPESDPEPLKERTGGTAMDELQAKYDALEREKQEAKERIRWIEDQQAALEKVLAMFR